MCHTCTISLRGTNKDVLNFTSDNSDFPLRFIPFTFDCVHFIRGVEKKV